MNKWFTVAMLALVLAMSGFGQSYDRVHTPAVGSAERKIILDSLRGDLDVLFKVNFFKVHNGWAWVDATPQDSRGNAVAEGGSNLLHLEHGLWKVVDLSQVPEDPNDPLGAQDASPRFIRNIINTFPGIPSDIFPRSDR